jgi:hypothetical protein
MKCTARGIAAATVFTVVAVAGCATTRSGADDSESYRSDLITREEILGVQGVRNLFEVVQRLRPRWLTIRAGDRSFGMTTEIAVYQGQTYMGDVETLRQMGPTLPHEMRWMDGQTAMTTLPGLGAGKHLAGAIIISMRPTGG